MTGTRQWRTAIAALVALAAASTLAACSEGGVRVAPAVDHTPAAPTADRASSAPAEAVVRAADGATARVAFRVGPAEPLASVSDEAAQSCRTYLGTLGRDAVGVPITVEGTVTSSSPIALAVRLDDVRQAGAGEPTRTSDVLWAVTYSDVPPQCKSGYGAGRVRWDASSGVRHTWSTWLVVPSGAGDPATLVIQPSVVFGQALGGPRLTFDTPAAPIVVQCGEPPRAGGLAPTYLALDADAALEAGCRTGSGATATPITDRLCHAQYPNGSSTSSGGRTTYDREASLAQVCGGFGRPEGLRLTPGMRCALIAAGATFGPAPVGEPIERLCDAENVTSAFRDGSWLAHGDDLACGYFSEIFAGGAGIVAAGASGPGGVAIGVGTYKALSATLKVACGGVFDGGAAAAGSYLEARHETNVSVDIVRRGKCLRLDTRHGSRFDAVACP